MPSTATITRDTTLCVSLAARPSNLGTRSSLIACQAWASIHASPGPRPL